LPEVNPDQDALDKFMTNIDQDTLKTIEGYLKNKKILTKEIADTNSLLKEFLFSFERKPPLKYLALWLYNARFRRL
jgi:hypothetical protein